MVWLVLSSVEKSFFAFRIWTPTFCEIFQLKNKNNFNTSMICSRTQYISKLMDMFDSNFTFDLIVRIWYRYVYYWFPVLFQLLVRFAQTQCYCVIFRLPKKRFSVSGDVKFHFLCFTFYFVVFAKPKLKRSTATLFCFNADLLKWLLCKQKEEDEK